MNIMCKLLIFFKKDRDYNFFTTLSDVWMQQAADDTISVKQILLVPDQCGQNCSDWSNMPSPSLWKQRVKGCEARTITKVINMALNIGFYFTCWNHNSSCNVFFDKFKILYGLNKQYWRPKVLSLVRLLLSS